VDEHDADGRLSHARVGHHAAGSRGNLLIRPACAVILTQRPAHLQKIVDPDRARADLLGGKAMNTRPLMMLRVNVATPQNIGAVPHGTRRTAPLSGGDFEGLRLRGTVMPGGSADWQLLRADGVLEMDLRVTLRTDDGALISMKSFGLRHGPPDVMAAIGRGETVDPATYYFRTTPRFETAHPAYAFLNRLVAVASGDRRAEGPIYTIHEVL
jgi:hypothetical protein